MTAKHTPGPWIAEWRNRTSDDGLEQASGWHVFAGDQETSGEPVICEIPDANRLDGCRVGNARLIAAAPDLLSVARCALADLEGFAEVYGSDEPCDMTIRELRAAIAKAEGGPL